MEHANSTTKQGFPLSRKLTTGTRFVPHRSLSKRARSFATGVVVTLVAIFLAPVTIGAFALMSFFIWELFS